MTQVGEGIAITQVKDPEEDHWAQLEYTYPDGSPVQGMFTAVDGSGMTWTGYLNDQGQACLAGLPSGSVDYQLLPSESLEDELKDIRDQIKTVLDGILEEQRAEAKAHQEELDKQSTLGKSYSYTAAVGRGLWNGAIGLLTFAKDVVVKAGEAALFLSPVTRMNNLLQASYTSYRNGKLTWADWRQSLTKNYQDEEFKDLADLLGIDIRNLDKDEVLLITTEAYEIVAYIADDAEFRDMFIQFGKDYAGAQSSIEWAEFAGGGLFEIVLTALLLAFTGGLGNAAQIASKIRHAARLRTLGGMLRKLGKLLQRKKLNKKTQGGVDSKHKVEAEKPEGQKLRSAVGGEVDNNLSASSGSRAAPALPNPDNVVFRTDSHPRSHQGSVPGRLKSHIDEHGNLVPANPNGIATPIDHVRGSEPRKSDSPYTSFSKSPSTEKLYGDTSISVDMKRLQEDIDAGLVRDVEVIDHESLLKIHDEAIQKAKTRYDNNPSPKNLERLERALMDKDNSARDEEVLIKGTVPSTYIKH